jgi:hypothetical protein
MKYKSTPAIRPICSLQTADLMADAFDADKDEIGAVSASLINFKGCRAFSG